MDVFHRYHEWNGMAWMMHPSIDRLGLPNKLYEAFDIIAPELKAKKP